MLENFKEGMRSIRANLLRSVLTAIIVTLGITTLVGSLTAVEGIRHKVNESLSSLGTNTFFVTSKRGKGTTRNGVKEAVYKPLQMNEVLRFKEQFNVPALLCVNADLGFAIEIKRNSYKTNPNVGVTGVTEDYMTIKALSFSAGRSFSDREIQYGAKVAILGSKIKKALFDDNQDPINAEISFRGTQFRVIGVLNEKGNFSENNFDNMVFIPLIVANQMASGRGLDYIITGAISEPEKMEMAMGEANGIMRNIRRDQIGKPNSFELERSDAMAELNSLMGTITFVGFIIGFLTLLGSALALMNIMLVSVTERTREVGVRKALGATPTKIRQQFIIEAIVVCLLGGIAGIILGVMAGNFLATLLKIGDFVLPVTWMIFGVVVCVIVGLGSGYYPANKAAKLDPIESLRFE